MSAVPQAAISEVVEPVATWTPQRDDPDGAFVYIDLSAVDQDAKAITGARHVACADAPSRARQLLRADDVLVSTVRPNLNAVARVPRELDGATASTGFCVVRPRPDRLDGGYIFHWLRSPRFIGEMVRLATGASYPAVSDRIVLDSTVSLPPLREQRRIAEILDKADALRAKRRAALAQLDTLTKSIFLDMFGDPIANPRGWERHSLAAVSKVITDGTHKTPAYTQSGVIFVSAKDISDGQVVWDTRKFISAQEHQQLIRRCNPERGDVLLAKSGSLGAVALVDQSREFSLFESVCLIKPDRDLVEARFLVHLMRSSAMLSHLLRRNKGVAIKHLHLVDVRSLRIPLPPLALQRLFAERLAAVENLSVIQRSGLAELDAFFASLQHRAFRGELL